MAENNENQNQQQDAGKDEKKFQEALGKVIAILGDPKKLEATRKVGTDTIGQIVEELTKEDSEKVKEEVKADLKKLIETHISFKKAVKEKKAELEKLEKDKKKEFTEQANKLFQKVDGIGELQARYAESLGEAGPQSDILNTNAALAEEGSKGNTQ